MISVLEREGFGTRVLYSDDEKKAFEDSRAVILTGSRAVRGVLAHRSLVVRLNPIAEHARWTESDLKEEFEKVQPLVSVPSDPLFFRFI